MKKIGIFLSLALVGVSSAVTYYLFEAIVHGAISNIWYGAFNSSSNRLLVIPLALIFSLCFFGLQHYLDPDSENVQEHGLGNMPKPTMVNYLRVLLIGFFSLVAGAALGPEAILVPACMVLGGYIGVKVFANDKQVGPLLAAAALMGLFTAFFDSFWIGVLSLLLVLAQSKTKFKPILLVAAVIASASAKLTLNVLEGQAYVRLPNSGFNLSFATAMAALSLVVCGYLAVLAMSAAHTGFLRLRSRLKNRAWYVHATVGALLLAGLMLLGGPLVEFTGNKSIEPMFNQAASLGLVGLLWLLACKIAIISWSKAIGYRGGMIFPTVFLAAVMVAVVQLYVVDFSIALGVVAVLIGAFTANKKCRILV
jgi:hypothetical protein